MAKSLDRLEKLENEGKVLRILYYEAHVTIDPPATAFDRDVVKLVAEQNEFRIAKLFMRKDSVDKPHEDDTFMTMSSTDLDRVKLQTLALVACLKGESFTVKRYKIEGTIIDSRNWDTLKIL